MPYHLETSVPGGVRWPGDARAESAKRWPRPSGRGRWPSCSCTGTWRRRTASLSRGPSSLECGPDAAADPVPVEKLTDEQLTWLCERGHVEAFPVGAVYAEGDPATCFYVLLEGTVVLSRRVGRPASRGGAGLRREARTPGRSGPTSATRCADLQQRAAGGGAPSRFFVLDARVRRADERVVPDGGAPAGGRVFRSARTGRRRSGSGSGCSRSARCRPG